MGREAMHPLKRNLQVGSPSYKASTIMHQPFSLKDRKIISGTGLWPDDTEELPAIPKESSYSGVSNPYPNNPCPYWHAPQQRRPIDFEQKCVHEAKKWFTRLIYVAGILYVVAITSILLQKVLVMVIALK